MSLSTETEEKPVVTPAHKAGRGRRGGKLSNVITLAGWRVRETWRLLVITGLGSIAAVMLVCAVPLYSDVSMTAGLRGVIGASYQSSDIVVQGQSAVVSLDFINKTTQQLNAEFQDKLGAYLKPSEFSVIVPYEALLVNHPTRCSGPQPPYLSCDIIGFISTSMQQAGSHLHLIQGHLPGDSTDGKSLDIALTDESAAALHVTVGSLLHITFTSSETPVKTITLPVTLHVVGIFTPPNGDDPFWHGNTYESVPRGTIGTAYTALASSEAALSLFDKAFTNPALANTTLDGPLTLQWYYPLDPSRIVIGDLDTILGNIYQVQVDVSNNVALNQPPQLSQPTVLLPSDILQRYHDRIAVANIPVLSLLVFVLALALFFVSMMANFLVERQSDSITILRSRGASRSQIFGSFMVQSITLGLLALVAGPLLAVLLVFLVIQRTLSQTDQNVLAVISGNPGAVAANLGVYALIAAVASVFAMALAIYRAMRFDILALRRETARQTTRPAWQRINLDIVAIIITLVGFGVSYYITNSGVLDPQLRLLLLSPLTLLETVFLLIACLLLFLRLFQLLLRLGAWTASYGRGASSMLALAQMARSPRQSMRMTLLFSLATAFMIFTFIFIATQAQRVPAVSAYQTGADFSGTPSDDSLEAVALDSETSLYRHVPGVTSATLGYQTETIGGGNILSISIQLVAVDANSFAQTAGPNWTDQNSSQPLPSLMAQLTQARKGGIIGGAVPAFVDSAAWTNLHLSPGKTFELSFSTYGSLIFVAEGEINSIPTIDDNVSGSSSGDVPSGAVLVDYRTLAPIYNTAFAGFGAGLIINYAWLRSRDDATSLASVRKALTSGCCLTLNPLYDRRATIANLQNDPLSIDLLGLLTMGATTAMLLALAGSLIASWLNARSRVANFAVLRALGASPPQIAGILTWEQAIVYITSLLLGLFFGAVLAALALPVMVFTSVPSTGASSSASSSTFFVQQNTPPIQIVIPVALVYVLVALVLVCIIALALMIRVVSRPSVSQTLRLNED
jgi:ABC-type lipoprotein release transport system permease subunit